MADQPTAPSQPPPNYGGVPGYQPVAGGVESSAPLHVDAPPKYEPPADGPYSQQPPPAGYAPLPHAGYPQPAGYAGGYQGQHVVHNTILVQPAGFSALPRQMECPNCRAFVTTSVNSHPGGLAWLSAGLLCLFGCWMGCCLIPFCIDDLQDVDHRCPNCGRHLGSYHRI